VVTRQPFAAFLVAGVALLMACASASSRPPPTDQRDEPLVDIATLDDSIAVQMRYATTNNFTGRVLYPSNRCLLRHSVAQRLVKVHQALQTQGLGLKVWDCYRPFSIQRVLWARVRDERYVARPIVQDGQPVAGSKHNRGAAVDLTLIDSRGIELEMPSRHDDFTERAHRDYRGNSARAQQHMEILERAMVAEGFEPLISEWWHFDGPGWQSFSILDVPLEP
jgi:D-alanyl-D-alanine dipeptidase